MKFSSRVKPISYLMEHASELADDVAQTREPMLITEDGEAKLVVIDVQTYKQQQETMALLKLLAVGNGDIEQGRFRDADEVFAELDKDQSV